MKEVIWNLLPGFIRKAWSGNSGADKYGWHGDYSDWTSAKNASGGYDSHVIADKVLAAALEVKRGNAFAERDGIVFGKPEFPQQTLDALQKSADLHGGNLSVLDFGGGPGSSYFLYKKLLKNVKQISWRVIEQAQFCEKGNRELADESLSFFVSSEEAIAGFHPDVLLLSSVMHYLEFPQQILPNLIIPEISTVIIETTPFVDHTREHITVQRVPPHIYDASYPCRLFVEKTFLEWFAGFEVKERYVSRAVDPRMINGKRTEWLGFVLVRTN